MLAIMNKEIADFQAPAPTKGNAAVMRVPKIIKNIKNGFFAFHASASAPRNGEQTATKSPEIESPIPSRAVFSAGSAPLSQNDLKRMGKNAVSTTTANAEFAQSYMHQAATARRFVSVNHLKRNAIPLILFFARILKNLPQRHREYRKTYVFFSFFSAAGNSTLLRISRYPGEVL